MCSSSCLLLAASLFAAGLIPSAHAACPVPIGGWGTFGSGPGEFNLPNALIRDPSNRWLVCDQHNNRVQIFDINGGYLGSFGEDAGLLHPSGVVVGPNNLVYVADHQHHRVVVFTLAGTFVQSFFTYTYPVGVTVDESGHLYVAVDGQIREYFLDGTLADSVGLGTGVLARPYGVRYGPDGNLWVSDYGNHRVHRLTTSGAGRPVGRPWRRTGPVLCARERRVRRRRQGPCRRHRQ